MQRTSGKHVLKLQSKLVNNDISYNKSLALDLAASSVKLHSLCLIAKYSHIFNEIINVYD